MLANYIKTEWLNKVYIFLYACLVIFLPFNKVGLSIVTALLVVTTVLFTPLPTYINRFKNKRSFRLLFLLFCWVFISLSWSDDWLEGVTFINLILPFFVLFFVFLLHPISKENDGKIIAHAFLFSVLTTTVINLFYYFTEDTNDYAYDIRELSLFTSHIRLSLMVVAGIVISGYFWLRSSKKWRWFYFVLAFYFLYYTYLAEVISGYISLLIVALVGGVALLTQKLKNPIKVMLVSVFLMIGLGSGIVFGVSKWLSRPQTSVLLQTKQGKPYWSDTLATIYENGYPVSVNIQMSELEEEWAKRSSYNLDSSFFNNIPLRWSVIRYLTSKGLNKDAEGVRALTNEDIQNIEKGQVSILDNIHPLKARLISMNDELLAIGVNPNGYTFLQRLEYWKAGISIVKENPLIGVGSGGAKEAFSTYYVKTNSPLSEPNRRQSHQQFLSIAVNYGLIGLFVFVLFLVFLLREVYPSKYVYAILVFLIVSFFTEDTLETQVGATLFSLLGLFVVDVRTKKDKK